jgi:hypothetical protein
MSLAAPHAHASTETRRIGTPLLLLLLLLASQTGACADETTDGDVGRAEVFVDNQSDAALTLTVAIQNTEPVVNATSLPPLTRTLVVTSEGCFGCADPPSFFMTRFALTTADGRSVVLLDPVEDADFSTTTVGTYNDEHVLTVTQAQVDAAL